MEDLRLVGVHEDGQHLLLAGDDGKRFRLPLDDALRAAARRDRPRLGQLQIELDGGLRPREVQALIRAGLSAQEVAARAGWTVEKVHRYEGPVLAEREYIAQLARAVRLRAHGRNGDAESLANRVGHRLTGRGVDPARATWDAARDAEGQWSVLVLFSAGGRERTATWWFDVPARTVSARDDEARWLSEEDTDQSGPIPSPHHPSPSSAPTTVYDIESDGGVSPKARRRPQDPIDLMAAMRESSRSRRPRRRVHQPTLTPVDDDPRDDATPLEPVHHEPEGQELPPAARGPHPLDSAQESDTGLGNAPGSDAGAPGGAHVDTHHDAADADLPGAELEAAAVSDGPTLVEPPRTRPTSVPRPAAPDSDDDADDDEHIAQAAVGHRPRRGGRPSVPKWDDIMFGAKGPAADHTHD